MVTFMDFTITFYNISAYFKNVNGMVIIKTENGIKVSVKHEKISYPPHWLRGRHDTF